MTLVLASAATYVLLWTFLEPLGIPDTIDTPWVMKSRGFYHIVLTLLVGAYITLTLELLVKRKSWSKFHFPHDPTLPVRGQALSLDDVQNGITILADYARQFGPDFIYGINRGGAIVGGCIAKQLGIPYIYLLTVNCDYKPEDRVTEHRCDGAVPSGKVLLIDDAKRKGEHMREASAFLTARYKGIALRRVVLLELRVPHQGPEKTTFRDDPMDRAAFFTNDATILLPWDPC